jgi:hypothetical protein
LKDENYRSEYSFKVIVGLKKGGVCVHLKNKRVKEEKYDILGASYGSCNSMHTSRFLASGVGTHPSHYSDGMLHVSQMASRERE